MINAISILYFVVLIFSIIFHEVAHGVIAEREGDPTARNLGRITLNPLKHLDWFGSVILPAILIFITHGGIVFGWAKPVPYNPENLHHGRKSEAKVAIAGIIVNISIAIFFALVIRAALAFHFATIPFLDAASIIVLVNIVLAFFNSIPLAPLDGFRFLYSVLPVRAIRTMRAIEQFSLPLLVVFVFFGWNLVSPAVFWVFRLLTGIAVPL